MPDESMVHAPRAGTPIDETHGNGLLRMLSSADLSRLLRDSVTVPVAPGEVLLEADGHAAEVLLPGGPTVLSLLALLPERKPVETLMVGAEGATGPLLGPLDCAFGFRVQARTSGPLIRIGAAAFAEAVEASPSLRRIVLRYAAVQTAQAQIGVACAALHPVEARSARWMLDLQARLGDRAMPLTQEMLADLLGVRRTTITRVVATLEARGLVRHRRGRISVTDRPGFAETACACHERMQALFTSRIGASLTGLG
jgi:hypothetical protein